MALNPLYWDSTGRRVKRGAQLGGYKDYFFTSTGQTQFVVGDAGVVVAGVKIDVWQNGVFEEEGVAADEWTRNTGANAVDFNTSVPANGEVRIRIHT